MWETDDVVGIVGVLEAWGMKSSAAARKRHFLYASSLCTTSISTIETGTVRQNSYVHRVSQRL